MSFFNKKEEVIDIQLTRFGKRSLSRGEFKPFYYQFFDDDIIYNAEFAGVNETQNQTQDRILEDTPRLKKNVNISHADREFTSTEFSISGEEAEKKFFSNNDQDRVLLYPLSNYETDSIQAPYIEINSFDANISIESLEFQHLSSSGIYKKIPQLEMSSLYTLSRLSGVETTDEQRRRMNNSNNFVDLKSDKIEFLDKSELSVVGEKIILSFEEANSYYNMANFELEIYEMDNFEDIDEETGTAPIMRRIKNINDINNLFRIVTDEDVQDVQTSFGRRKNWYRTGE